MLRNHSAELGLPCKMPLFPGSRWFPDFPRVKKESRSKSYHPRPRGTGPGGQPEVEQRDLVAASLHGPERKLYELLSTDEPRHMDDVVERSGLNSSEVLATLFNLETKGIIRQLPGKQFSKSLL